MEHVIDKTNPEQPHKASLCETIRREGFIPSLRKLPAFQTILQHARAEGLTSNPEDIRRWLAGYLNSTDFERFGFWIALELEVCLEDSEAKNRAA